MTAPAQNGEGTTDRDRQLSLTPILASRNPATWVVVFGPGAIIASLTIGTGELVFSSRAGALFGYDILWLFLVACILKWVLVFSTARHMVLSGVHPFQRWIHLPGPRGWFPLLLLLFAVPSFPIWLGFLAGVLGTLAEHHLALNAHVAGAIAIGLVTILALVGGYTALERVQLGIVGALLLAVGTSLVLLNPDWLDALRGLFVPGRLHYPEWLPEFDEKLAARPVWLETITYVGVIGGSAYDYLSYVSFLRNKAWGFSSGPVCSSAKLEGLKREEVQTLRGWLRAPLIDCSLSFAIVLVFSIVFVLSGAIVLGPQHKIPVDSDLLQLQSEFVTRLHPWFLPLYVAGATLALVGTLYGVLEVGPAVMGEILRAFRPNLVRLSGRLRRWVIFWVSGGGLIVLAWSFVYTRLGEAGSRPPALVAIITPVNLFTGVLACGFICLLNPWTDRRFLPHSLRMPRPLLILNILAGIVFVILGAKGYWEEGEKRFPQSGGGWVGVPIFLATLALGWLLAWRFERRAARND